MPELRTLSVRRLRGVTLALAAMALVAGCSRETRYPDGWSPLVSGRKGCAALAGTWRVHDMNDQERGMGVLTNYDLVRAHTQVHWEVVSILPDEDGIGLNIEFVQHARQYRWDAAIVKRHVDVDPRLCESGLSVVERHEGREAWTVFRLGQDTAGRLVAQRMTHLEGLPLLHWGDSTALNFGRSTKAWWSRWQPIPAAEFEAVKADVMSQATAAAPPTAASAPDRSPFAPSPAPFAKTPPLPIPPAPPTRPGALPFGEAQAIVLSALPDSALFGGMTPTPRGYSLRVSTQDPQAIAQLAQRLAGDGHFEVKAGASAATGDVTLELVERGLR